jgi:universal stress protein E
MKLINKVLLAIDFTDASDSIIKQGLHLSSAFQTELVVLHVLPKDLGNEKVEKLLEETARGKLAELQSRLKEAGGIVGDALLKWGHPKEVVIETAQEIGANGIMVGAGTPDKHKKYPLGVTTENIIRWSDIPVWVVQPDGPSEIKTILCPVDFSEPSTRALENAIMVARRYNAELIVFSVYEHLSARGLIYYQKEWDEQQASGKQAYQRQLAAYLVRFNWHNVKWKREIKNGVPEVQILQAIEDHNVDMLVMGTTGRSGLSRILMGSVTEKVVREVPCHFITTKSEDIVKLELDKTIRDIETHFKIAQQLVEDGLFKEAIQEYKKCLQLSHLHLPSLNGLVKVYEKIGDEEMVAHYKNLSKEALQSIWNAKIEEDIRRGR